jgi:putative ABC transport system ATP-binding protein
MSVPAAAQAGIRESGGEPSLVLELDAVSKTYPGTPPVQALRGVSFAVKAGELVGIVGPSGSGKSTLLHLMGTLDRPTAGIVRVTGLDVISLSDRELSALRATAVGFVFQQFFLNEYATALDNVAEALLYAGVGLGVRRQQAADALARVAGRPAIVLADEPTGNLDQATGQSILGLLEELHADGSTIVVITHDQAIAARMPRQIRMLDGRIVPAEPAES